MSWQPVIPRSSKLDVRNPITRLSAFRRLREVLNSPAAFEVKASFIDALKELRADCASRAQESWKRHKPPMACYWKVCSVVIGHIIMVLR